MQKLYIDGKWVDALSGKFFDVLNPANNDVVDTVSYASAEDAALAVEVAQKAFATWKEVTQKEKARILRKFYELILERREELARIIVIEQGKAMTEARSEVDYAASFVEWFAEEAKRTYGDIVPSQKSNQLLFSFKEPVGVVAAITPWNFPAAMITRKIAPAIAAGCTVIVKPSEETPLTAFYLAKLFEEAGLPRGVLNVICGDAKEIGRVLTTHFHVKMLTFTGSTQVGKILMAQCSNTVKKVALELGGNAPFIVFDDANIALAVSGVVASKLRSGGQSCICVNRIFVHEKIFDSFAKAVVEEFKKIKVGNGLDQSINLGPLINKAATDKISRLIENATNNGSTILYQGQVENTTGCFCAPTIISHYSDDVSMFNEEIFGPVISLFKFSAEEDVIKRANSTKYGLASYFYTEDRKRIWRVARALEYGMVGINDVALSTEATSFGGVKESGLGREGGKSGILEYLEDKFVAVGD